MKPNLKLTAVALASAIGLSVAAPMTAEAGSKGKRNTAIGLGAVAAYGVVKKKPLVAGLAGGGAIYSYMRSRQDAKKESARRRTSSRGRYVYSRKARRYVRVR